MLMGKGNSHSAVTAAGASAPKSYRPDDDGIDFVR
jgi:hypothetical protein